MSLTRPLMDMKAAPQSATSGLETPSAKLWRILQAREVGDGLRSGHCNLPWQEGS